MITVRVCPGSPSPVLRIAWAGRGDGYPTPVAYATGVGYSHLMTTYTVQIEVPAADGWQAIAPSETIDTAPWGPNWTADELADSVVADQTEVEKGILRVLVWTGTDTTVEPVVSQEAHVDNDDE